MSNLELLQEIQRRGSVSIFDLDYDKVQELKAHGLVEMWEDPIPWKYAYEPDHIPMVKLSKQGQEMLSSPQTPAVPTRQDFSLTRRQRFSNALLLWSPRLEPFFISVGQRIVRETNLLFGSFWWYRRLRGGKWEHWIFDAGQDGWLLVKDWSAYTGERYGFGRPVCQEGGRPVKFTFCVDCGLTFQGSVPRNMRQSCRECFLNAKKEVSSKAS